MLDTSDPAPKPPIPAVALALGWLGVAPFAVLAAALHMAAPDTVTLAQRALISYGAIILAFMGGVQWGLEMRRPDAERQPGIGYAASVLPALVAFAATLLPAHAAIWLLIDGFAALLAYDLWRIRCGIAPAWYARLRWQLSLAVLGALLVALLAGRVAA